MHNTETENEKKRWIETKHVHVCNAWEREGFKDSLTYFDSTFREILELQEAKKDLMNPRNERDSERIRRVRTAFLKKPWKGRIAMLL